VSWPLSLQDMDLPRRNGELAFDAPWQSTVFALAAAVIENAFGGDREPFRQQLIAAIAAEPGRPYWESWTTALEALVQTLAQPRAGGPARLRSKDVPSLGSLLCRARRRRMGPGLALRWRRSLSLDAGGGKTRARFAMDTSRPVARVA